MTYRSSAAAWSCEGSSALEVHETCHLVLLEGGLSSSDSGHEPRVAENDSPVAELSARQFAVMVLACAAFVGVLVLSTFVGNAQASSRLGALDDLPTQTVVVSEGDSLWQIASECSVEGYGTRELVSWIEERNGLDGGLIVVGQTLVVPSASVVS